jgi:ribosomal protein S18 acetylase RimI-like enzyme
MRIRPSAPADRGWILERAPRLHEFGPPPWREREVMDAAVTRSIASTLDAPTPAAIVLVAEEDRGALAGFVHVVTATDFFTGEPHGHISDLVVASEAEGRGVGRALLEGAERWARDAGYRLLSLNVFEENVRARRLYEGAGYVPEMTKFMKELR